MTGLFLSNGANCACRHTACAHSFYALLKRAGGVTGGAGDVARGRACPPPRKNMSLPPFRPVPHPPYSSQQDFTSLDDRRKMSAPGGSFRWCVERHLTLLHERLHALLEVGVRPANAGVHQQDALARRLLGGTSTAPGIETDKPCQALGLGVALLFLFVCASEHQTWPQRSTQRGQLASMGRAA